MSNFWREIQNGLSDCKYWGISEKILRKEYFSATGSTFGTVHCWGHKQKSWSLQMNIYSEDKRMLS